jgi:uncharacterized membrane protein required for colicin V production
MNQVDLFVIVLVVVFAVSGSRRGLISSAGDIISIALALGIGSVAYPLATAPIAWLLHLPPNLAGPLGYLLVTAIIALSAGWGCSALANRFEPSKHISRVGGAAFGGVLGAMLAGVLVLASGLLPGAGSSAERSLLGRNMIQVVPRLHEGMESIGLPMPKLVQLPEDYRDELEGMRQGLQFMRLNFTRLNGATCIHCRTPVDFLGYKFSRGTLMSPKFQCPNCGRTSDGCQTFEGFHAIYRKCPVDLAEQGVEFDCGVWTNGWWTVPHGMCPVRGTEFRGELPPPRSPVTRPPL